MSKHLVSLKLFAGLAVVGGLLLAGPTLLALGSASGQLAVMAQDQSQGQEKAQTFTGKIAKSTEGELVLQEGKDPNNKTTYKLDDQEKAKQYVGKNVKVTGTLDAATNTIHVAAIEEGTT